VEIYTTVVKKYWGKLLWSPFRETEDELVEKKNFRQELLSRGFGWENSSGIGLHWCWISCSFPYTDVALPDDAFPVKSLRTSDILCSCSIEGHSLHDSGNCLIRPVSLYGLDVPRLAIVVGEHCDRCSSQAVVCELWLYNCSLWHLFHYVAERMCAKRCLAKPDFVVCGIELLALAISLLLKQSIWRWIEMPQVVLEHFTLGIFQTPRRKLSSHPIHLQHLRGLPGDLCM